PGRTGSEPVLRAIGPRPRDDVRRREQRTVRRAPGRKPAVDDRFPAMSRAEAGEEFERWSAPAEQVLAVALREAGTQRGNVVGGERPEHDLAIGAPPDRVVALPA